MGVGEVERLRVLAEANKHLKQLVAAPYHSPKGRVAGGSEGNASRRYEVEVNPPGPQTCVSAPFSTDGHGLSWVGSTS